MKKKNVPTKKLSLNKQTLVQLDSTQMQAVKGGLKTRHDTIHNG